MDCPCIVLDIVTTRGTPLFASEITRVVIRPSGSCNCFAAQSEFGNRSPLAIGAADRLALDRVKAAAKSPRDASYVSFKATALDSEDVTRRAMFHSSELVSGALAETHYLERVAHSAKKVDK